MPDRIVSRAALLEIRRDRAVVEEGYRFLDEKRIMLAQELLRRLNRYRELMVHWVESEQEAQHALRAALARHGVEGLLVYPVPAGELHIPDQGNQPFLGITLRVLDGQFERIAVAQEGAMPSNPSREAAECAEHHARLLQLACELAVARTNLLRLRDEYRRTERRVRSLENVIIPELRAEQRGMEERLDENDQEEMIRAHLFIGKRVREASGNGAGTESVSAGDAAM